MGQTRQYFCYYYYDCWLQLLVGNVILFSILFFPPKRSLFMPWYFLALYSRDLQVYFLNLWGDKKNTLLLSKVEACRFSHILVGRRQRKTFNHNKLRLVIFPWLFIFSSHLNLSYLQKLVCLFFHVFMFLMHII